MQKSSLRQLNPSVTDPSTVLSPSNDLGAKLRQYLSVVQGITSESPWKYDPVPFIEFVTSKQHMRFPDLSPKQLEAAYAVLNHDPKKTFDTAEKLFDVVCCLWANAKLQDAFTGQVYTIKELCDNKIRIPVACVDDNLRSRVTLLEVPWKRGTDQLYEIVTKMGKRIFCTLYHRLRTESGWAWVRDLKVGDMVLDDPCPDNCTCGRHNNPALAGRPAWNKGLTKETDIRVASVSQKMTMIQNDPEWKAAHPSYERTSNIKTRAHELWTDEKRKAKSIEQKEIQGRGQENSFKKKHPDGFQGLSKEERSTKFGNHKEEHPLWGKHQSEQSRKQNAESNSETISRLIAEGRLKPSSNPRGITGHYVSTQTREVHFFRSMYELKRMQEMDAATVRWTTNHKIRIPYIRDDGRKAFYCPDFLVEGNIIEEMKSDFTARGFVCTWVAAEEWCLKNGYKFRIVKYGRQPRVYCTDPELVEAHGLGKYAEVNTKRLVWDEIVSITPTAVADFYDVTAPQFHNYLAEGLYHHNCLWGKGSLAHDELVMDAVSGDIKPVSKWAELRTKINVRAYDFETHKMLITRADPFVLEDTGDLVEVSTEARYTVRVSVDHKFYDTNRQWKPIKGFKVGEQIATSFGLPIITDLKWTRITNIRPLEKGAFYGVTVPKYGNYFHNNILHQNSGKDSLAAIIVCYISYILLCLKDPYKFLTGYSVPDEAIDIVNVAYSYDQANNVFFTKLKSRVKNWYWLRKNFRVRESGKDLDPKQDKAAYLEDKSSNTVVIYPASIMFPNMIRAFSRHSLAESTEGLNIISFVLDEACFDWRQPITLADGTKRCIGRIVNGKESVSVLSYNFETGQIEPKRVVAWHKHPMKYPHHLRLRFNEFTGGCTKTILGTPNHHIFAEHGLKRLDELSVGDKVYCKGYFLSAFQKQALYGTMLGDSYISPLGQLCFTHGQDQQGYLEFKCSLFERAVSGGAEYPGGYKPSRRIFKKWLHKCEDISVVAKLVYPGGKKTITPELVSRLDIVSLTYWFLDDGSWVKRKHKYKDKVYTSSVVSFCTAGFKRNEVDLLYQRLVELGFVGGIYQDTKYKGTTKGWCIYLNPVPTREFLRQASQYIPSCMQYKSPFLCNFVPQDTSTDVKLLPLVSVEYVKPLPTRTNVYDIEVEDNHNYFASDVLVSNSAMKDTNQKANADKLYEMLTTSAQSRFPGKWFGFVLSWPRHRNDFTMKMYTDAIAGKLPRVFASRGATWEVNPTKTYEDFKEAMTNPKTQRDSEAKYACNPPAQEAPFIEFTDKIMPCVRVGQPQVVSFEETLHTFPTGAVKIGKVIKGYNAPRRPDSVKYVARVDLGETHDSATLTIAHEESGVAVVDVSTHWEAKPKLPIDVDDPAEIIIELKRNFFNIVYVTFDQWNSASSINRLERLGIKAEKLSLNIEDYKLFRDMLYGKQTNLPDYPKLTDPVAGELANLQLINNNKVDHPSTNTNDLSEGVVGVTAMLFGTKKNVSKVESTEGYYQENENDASNSIWTINEMFSEDHTDVFGEGVMGVSAKLH